MSTISITTPQNIEVEYDLASLGERVVGFILDRLIVIAYVVGMIMFIGFSDLKNFVQNNLWLTVFLVIPIFFYHVLCEVFLNGQSFGKRIMKMKVVSIRGNEPTLSQYLMRWIFRIVDFNLFSPTIALIVVAITKNNQRVGDLVAGTTLVKTIARTKLEDTLFVEEIGENYEPNYPEVVDLKDSDMQLIKEILNNIQKSGNTMLAVQAMYKIEQMIGIKSKHEPVTFLYTILLDYNHLTSKEK